MIQPRQDFYLEWADYKQGFGNLTGEFWWGLHYLWQLMSVKNRQFELRIDLEDFDGNKSHAVYQRFRISSEEDSYRLSASNYTGDATAAHGLHWGDNSKFSTRDRNQDDSYDNCAVQRQGGWWYGRRCGFANLNGRYLQRGDGDWTGVWWFGWKLTKSLKKTEMKIRPI